LILFASVGIVRSALPQILVPRALPNLQSGLLILLATSAINLLLGLTLVYTGKRTRSLVLTADGKHVLTDVYTTIGVLLGLLLMHLTGWLWIDGVVAMLVAVNIVIVGVRLIGQAVAGLMQASDRELLARISDLLTAHRQPEWIDVHRLRAWRSGDHIYLDLHLILPRDLSLEEAHTEATELQRLLASHLPGKADALVHVEPCIDSECPICGYDPCRRRSHAVVQPRQWHPESLTAELTEDSPTARERHHKPDR
jgi:cation diffusion facilitator family transporter